MRRRTRGGVTDGIEDAALAGAAGLMGAGVAFMGAF